MTGEERAAWAALAVFGLVYVLALALASVLRASAKASVAPASGDQSKTGANRSLAAAAGATVVAYVGALGAAFSLAFALGVRTTTGPWLSAAFGVAFALAAIGVHLGVGRARLGDNPALRRAAALLARVPGIPNEVGAGPPLPTASNVTSDVTATFAEDLHRLQQTGLEGESGELRMIRAVLSMDTARVREIMRPRVDMVAVRADATPQQAIELINQSGHSKVPIYADTIDDIVGVVYARDLLKLHDGAEPTPKSVRELARPAIYVPESQRLEQLLREFQKLRTEIAIVVDEYGGVSGLVTVQDLIEEIVGEIVDEFDRNEPEVERIGESEALMDARLSIDSFNEFYGIKIQPEGFDTVGGLVYRELGKMPVVGDTIEIANLMISVESTMGRRIRKLRVKRIPQMSDTAV